MFVMKCGAISYLNHAYSFAAALSVSEERSMRRGLSATEGLLQSKKELGGPLNVLVSSNKESECTAPKLPGVQEVISVSRREG